MGNLISNLNLDGRTAEHGQSSNPVWGPTDVPSTRAKKIQRITAWTGFVVAATMLLLMGIWMYVHLTPGG